MNKRIEFCPDGENETVGFFVVEETRIAGVSYLLVTESEDDEEAEAYILKDLAGVEAYFEELKEVRPDALIIADPGVFAIFLTFPATQSLPSASLSLLLRPRPVRSM